MKPPNKFCADDKIHVGLCGDTAAIRSPEFCESRKKETYNIRFTYNKNWGLLRGSVTIPYLLKEIQMLRTWTFFHSV
jgi:hypothetical protein